MSKLALSFAFAFHFFMLISDGLGGVLYYMYLQNDIGFFLCFTFESCACLVNGWYQLMPHRKHQEGLSFICTLQGTTMVKIDKFRQKNWHVGRCVHTMWSVNDGLSINLLETSKNCRGGFGQVPGSFTAASNLFISPLFSNSFLT